MSPVLICICNCNYSYPFLVLFFIQVKLCCSLRWLYGILSKHPTTPDPGYMLRLSHLLLEPYQENLLKNETILALTSPTLYVQAYDVVFPGEHLPESSFEAVTQALARKGGYVLEDDGTIVSVPMLAQQVPFREVRQEMCISPPRTLCLVPTTAWLIYKNPHCSLTLDAFAWYFVDSLLWVFYTNNESQPM